MAKERGPKNRARRGWYFDVWGNYININLRPKVANLPHNKLWVSDATGRDGIGT